MGYLSLMRRLHPCVGTQLLKKIKFKTPLFGKPIYLTCCSRLPCIHQRTLSYVFERSPHYVNVKMQCKPLQTLCLSSHSLSTSASNETTWNLVYTGNLGKAVVGVKVFSYMNSATCLFLMPLILNAWLPAQNLALQASFITTISLFTFVTPIILHQFTKGYVFQLFHNANEDTYKAVTRNIFLMEKTTVFKQGDVRIPSIAKMFSTFYAGRMGMLVHPDHFEHPSDYSHLMGYDQPFTFNEEDLERPDKD